MSGILSFDKIPFFYIEENYSIIVNYKKGINFAAIK